MKDTQIFQQGARSCLISLLSIVLAICAVAFSANYQHSQHSSCRDMLGAGFPVLFICDDWGGGSPTGSWNKIDFVDVVNGGIRPAGFFVDFLFYLLLILFIWFVTSRLRREGVSYRDVWWATLMILTFTLGFLFAFLTIWSSDSYVKNPPLGTPTPVIPSATASQALPIATSTP